MSILKRISPYYWHVFRHLVSFSVFYDCPLKLLLLLVFKLLISGRYEYYGICVQNTYMPIALGVAWQNTILIELNFYFNFQEFFVR